METKTNVGRGLIQPVWNIDDQPFFIPLTKKFRTIRSGQTIYAAVANVEKTGYLIISMIPTGKRSLVLHRSVMGVLSQWVRFPNLPPFGEGDVFFSLSEAKRWWRNHHENPKGRLPIQVETLGNYIKDY